MMLVSLAGPGMNILVAFAAMVLIKFTGAYQYTEWGSIAATLLAPLVYINLILAVFNLIPLPPLDGSKILAGILPDTGTKTMYALEQYAPLILLLLVFTGAAGKILWPVVNFLFNILYLIVF